MRKKIAVGVGLLLIVLLVSVVWHTRPVGPPLQAGMTWEEADHAVQESGRRFAYGLHRSDSQETPIGRNECGYIYWVGEYSIDGWFPASDNDSHYFSDVDLFGRHNEVEIYMKPDYKTVDRWEVKRLPPTRPPWLDKAMKWVGW